MARFQASVGNTTYTIEDQPDGRYVKLYRFNTSEPGKNPEFFVPVDLLIEYVVARISPRIARMLNQIGVEK